MSVKCACGKQTNEPSGLCVICKIEGKQKREETMTKGKCSIEGCQNALKSKGLCNKHYLIQLRADGRIGARNKKTVRVSRSKPLEAIKPSVAMKGAATAEPGLKEAVRLERPGSHKPGEAGSIPATAPTAAPKGDGKHLLGQMLYTSDLLDRQINEAISTGMIDTRVILDIRFMLGEVLRAGGGLEA